jgi:hypothetical protein
VSVRRHVALSQLHLPASGTAPVRMD